MAGLAGAHVGLRAVTVAALFCCCVPNFLVAGPLACGLYVCALRTLRGRPFDSGALWSDWTVAGRAILAHLVVTLATVLPIFASRPSHLAGFALFAGILGSQGPSGPSDQAVALGALAFLGSMILLAAGIVAVLVWTLWLSTRAMFVMLLIADRRVDFSTAWRMSWAETRNHFWELLLLKVVAGLIGNVGVYLFYVGLIWTLPIYFTMIAAAYEHRFPFQAEPAGEA